MQALGVHSEMGRLHEVMVHRPDLSLRRLTPANCEALLFDDVLWVKRARQEHDIFVDALRERNVTVRDLGEMLAQTLALPEARRWLLDRRVSRATVGCDLVDELRAWLDELPAKDLAVLLVGGVSRAELPFQPAGLAARTLAPGDFVLPPLPNQLFTRDSSCWIGGTMSVNAMFWPARRPGAVNVEAVYRFHPRFQETALDIFAGRRSGRRDARGGDVMPVGNGVVLVRMGRAHHASGRDPACRSPLCRQEGRTGDRSSRCRGTAASCISIPCSRSATGIS